MKTVFRIIGRVVSLLLQQPMALPQFGDHTYIEFRMATKDMERAA